jgi:hypothetical protein
VKIESFSFLRKCSRKIYEIFLKIFEKTKNFRETKAIFCPFSHDFRNFANTEKYIFVLTLALKEHFYPGGFVRKHVASHINLVAEYLQKALICIAGSLVLKWAVFFMEPFKVRFVFLFMGPERLENK